MSDSQPNVEMSGGIKNISKAVLQAQKLMGAAKKGADNPFFKSKYADLNSVLEVCKEPLNEAGVLILQPTEVNNGELIVSTMLVHAESGEWIKSSMFVIDAKDMQKSGSGVSYARRYTLQSLLSIPAEDDDGEKSMGRSNKVSKPAIKQEGESTQSSRPSGFGRK